MPEPITTIGGAAVVAYLSKDGVAKLLGPSAEYLGGELKDLIEVSQKNVASVFKKAEKKCGAKLEAPGTVNPRVLKHIYDEARFCENELFSEYFGGVLASSRTKQGTDDRGVYYTNIVQSLSSYQLRCHYLFYYLMWSLGIGKNIDISGYKGRNESTLILPIDVYSQTFDIIDATKESPFIAHSLAGLSKSDLISDKFIFGAPELIKKEMNIETNTFSFVIEPTITGVELFIWAHGKGESGLKAFSDPKLAENADLDIKLAELAMLKKS